MEWLIDVPVLFVANCCSPHPPCQIINRLTSIHLLHFGGLCGCADSEVLLSGISAWFYECGGCGLLGTSDMQIRSIVLNSRKLCDFEFNVNLTGFYDKTLYVYADYFVLMKNVSYPE